MGADGVNALSLLAALEAAVADRLCVVAGYLASSARVTGLRTAIGTPKHEIGHDSCALRLILMAM
jgi:hypothetical protein